MKKSMLSVRWLFWSVLAATIQAFLSLSAASAALEPMPVDVLIASDGRHLRERVLYWPATGHIAPDKVLQRAEFSPHSGRGTVLGATDHWYWLRLSNPSNETLKRYLVTGLPTTPQLFLYEIKPNEPPQLLFDIQSEQPFHSRPVAYPLLFLPIELLPESTTDFLIYNDSLANYPLAPRIFDENTLQSRMSAFTLVRGTIFGALIIFFVLFIVQLISSPSASLFYYCGYIASLTFLVGQIFGYNFAYLWPDHGRFNQSFTPLITGITYGFYFLFSAHLFDLKNLKLTLYRIIISLAFITLALAVVSLFIDVFWLMACLALVGLPLPVVVGLWALSQKLTSSYFFLAGSTLHCSLSYLLALEVIGIHIGYSVYLFSFLAGGQLFDLSLFSIAILRQISGLKASLQEQLEQRVKDAEALAKVEQERSAALAERQAQALSLASAGHDLTQPIAAIRFALALVDDEKSLVAKEHIVKSLNYTETLLKSIVSESATGFERSKALIDVGDLFDELASRHRPAFIAKQLQLRTKSTVETLQTMPITLTRILDNLLVNACRYTTTGGVLLTARRRGTGALVQVWDTGTGLRPQHVEKLSQPFQQGQDGVVQGYGLGLYIVKTLVNEAGLRLEVRSEPARGTCICIEVPASQRLGHR